MRANTRTKAAQGERARPFLARIARRPWTAGAGAAALAEPADQVPAGDGGSTGSPATRAGPPRVRDASAGPGGRRAPRAGEGRHRGRFGSADVSRREQISTRRSQACAGRRWERPGCVSTRGLLRDPASLLGSDGEVGDSGSAGGVGPAPHPASEPASTRRTRRTRPHDPAVSRPRSRSPSAAPAPEAQASPSHRRAPLPHTATKYSYSVAPGTGDHPAGCSPIPPCCCRR